MIAHCSLLVSYVSCHWIEWLNSPNERFLSHKMFVYEALVFMVGTLPSLPIFWMIYCYTIVRYFGLNHFPGEYNLISLTLTFNRKHFEGGVCPSNPDCWYIMWSCVASFVSYPLKVGILHVQYILYCVILSKLHQLSATLILFFYARRSR